MSSSPPFPVYSKQELDESASAMINALWTGFMDANGLFKTNPTPENWRTMIRALTMFRIAFVAESA